MKKTVLIFHPALVPYRVDFFNTLNKVYNANFYFKFSNALTQDFNQRELKKRCHFRCLYLDKGFEIFGKSFRKGIISKVKELRPEIVLCSEYGPITVQLLIYSKFFNPNFKLYSICDDSMDVALKRSGIRALVRDLVCRNIDGVIFNSDEVASWHIKNISSSLPHLTLPIVHKDSVLRTSFKESITTANYNIDARYLYGKQVILFTGRLEKVKNVDFLLKCFFKLKKDNLVLVLVGSGEQRSHLESLTKNNSNTANVIFTGRLEGEDLLSWYLIADLFVLPSTYEPYGAVVNEALIAGCNVLCSKYAGASSLITKNNGAIFDPFSERDLIEKMTYYLNHSQPITNKIEELRDNKMPFSFNERIDSLISAIG